MSKLLVIDDEPAILFSIEQVFAGSDVQVVSAASADDGLRIMGEEAPGAVLLDIRLRDRSGLEVFKALRQVDPRALVIFITGHGTADTAIEAMKLGAFDYLVKPLDVDQLRRVISQAMNISRLMHVRAIVDDADSSGASPERLVGSGAVMQAAGKQIGRIAPQDVNVLILGESGTGKELVARAIYQHSRRAAAPFLAINCAAIPESLLESELFGHERGAFTGAEQRRIGKFEQCDGGTLFLDEIGDMAPGTQAKMLRLLQEGCFQRVGGSQTIKTDVRILAATNQDLAGMIEQGRFRRDLFYRLRGVTIHLPALRERRGDIPELAHYFMFRFNRQLRTTVQSIDPEALEILVAHDWPGNVRELQSVIREALIVSAGTTLLPEFLPREVRHPATEAHSPADALSDDAQTPSPSDATWAALAELVDRATAAGDHDVYRCALALFDRLVIAAAMRRSDGQQNRAAEILGLSRVTLRAKLRAMRADVEKTLTFPARADASGGH